MIYLSDGFIQCEHMHVCFTVTDFVKTFNEKIEPFLQVEPKLTEEDSISLGRKDPEVYPDIMTFLIIDQNDVE